MNDEESLDELVKAVDAIDFAKCHFAIRKPSGEIRRCEPSEWLMWIAENRYRPIIVHATESAGEYRASVSFNGISEHPDRPTDFWTCAATTHCGIHDGALWSCKYGSESEAIEKAQWLVKHFADYGCFADGPELNLCWNFSEIWREILKLAEKPSIWREIVKLAEDKADI